MVLLFNFTSSISEYIFAISVQMTLNYGPNQLGIKIEKGNNSDPNLLSFRYVVWNTILHYK